MVTKQKKRWNIPGPIMDVLDDLIADHPGWNATEIYQEMERQIKSKENPPPIPTLRTVQSYVANSRPLDPTGRWVPTEWPGEDAALVLEALGAEQKWAGGGQWPTLRDAVRFLWVRKAAPTLPPFAVGSIARRYLLHEARGESTESLDYILAYRIWESSDAFDHYLNAIDQELVPFYYQPGTPLHHLMLEIIRNKTAGASETLDTSIPLHDRGLIKEIFGEEKE
ncbi:MAG: hypothetical protein O3A93_04765 [Chloroflexi bacterium]|nr:hypothetical protein [Chloroflexota bacterium]